MDMNYYQDFVRTTKVYPEQHSVTYPTLGLVGEAGELANKVKKVLRGDAPMDKGALGAELGDVLWYVASLADDLGLDLNSVATANVFKLKSRAERGVLKGSGDDR